MGEVAAASDFTFSYSQFVNTQWPLARKWLVSHLSNARRSSLNKSSMSYRILRTFSRLHEPLSDLSLIAKV